MIPSAESASRFPRDVFGQPTTGMACLLLFALIGRTSRSVADEVQTDGPIAAESSRDSLLETAAESDHLTGDWGGWRTALVERGVHIQAGYVGEGFGNVTGGLRRGAVYEGLAEAAVEFDFERLTGWWRGATVRASGIFPHGNSPSRELTGDVQTLSNIDAYDSVALYELWLEQTFWSGRGSVRAGQVLADAEFGYTDCGGTMLNSSFGWPAYSSSNTRNTGPAYYRAAPGARVRFEFAPGLIAQAGIYDGDTFDNDEGRPSGNPHGVNFRLSGHQGLFSIGELSWQRPAAADGSGLVGTYKIGGWWHTAEFEDVGVEDRVHGHNHGIYLAGQQRVWEEPDGAGQGLGVFLRAGVAPADRNFVSFGLDAGLHYVGLLPGRDADTLVLGVAGIWASDDLRAAQQLAGAEILSDREIAVELTYQIPLKPWLTIQPDIQWIYHPGGSRAIDNALVLGLRTRLTF